MRVEATSFRNLRKMAGHCLDNPFLHKTINPLFKCTPLATQDWLRRQKWKIKFGIGLAAVSVTRLTRKSREAWNWLSEQVGTESLGDYFEFGVFSGQSMAAMHRVIQELGLERPRLFGFDSFEGLPQSAKFEDNGYWQPGSFKMDLKSTRKYLTRQGIDWERVALVKGWFKDTLTPELVAKHQMVKASVIMVDCDLYSSAREALFFCAPLIKDKAVILFDDWAGGNLAAQNLGEKKAFDEFLAANPQLRAEDFGKYDAHSKVFKVSRVQPTPAPTTEPQLSRSDTGSK